MQSVIRFFGWTLLVLAVLVGIASVFRGGQVLFGSSGSLSELLHAVAGLFLTSWFVRLGLRFKDWDSDAAA